MTIVVAVVATLVVFAAGFVCGVVGMIEQQRRRTLTWMVAVEATARAKPNNMDMVELPGYQGMIRRYREAFRL